MNQRNFFVIIIMRIVTYTILAIMFLVYFTNLNNTNTGTDIIDYPLRGFYHADISHLLANSISFYALSFMEEILGWEKFITAIIFIWIVSSLILYAIHIIMPSRKVYTIGFSGVIFGLIVVYYTLLNKSKSITMAGLIISILPQLMVTGISFEGHLSGILAGIIYVTLFPIKN